MEGNIVFEGKTESGLSILIRYPTVEDAQVMRDYINELSKEQTFIAFYGKQFSLAEEQEVVRETIKKIQSKTAVQLLVFSVSKLIAVSDITLQTKEVFNHEGTFGLSVLREYRGKGIRKILMQFVVNEAIKYIPQLRIITLSVFSNNPIAINLYKKFGFVEFGRLPQGVLHKGNFVDHVYMYKKIR
ncbi:MAG: hypothetical protein A3F31_02995 [Candidatus Levybacteria bacterium RIFCSPHIGHO2_12_FULL_38_12]|nr:MAG: hypothetical protein A2770_00555 [Candidatus Levybacteria bacterium RIFCSPHIGHO2_01_FULL_38_12]OGH22655.1 MAG: hypothetical protein A3F31_02995 [Candidatus Levybacteria bacterium RIFCSPHIGHO2_12_FULL_38_12]OGH44994.1 MAG: hypothetical protein A3J14_03915 [Candidatus Levybacteria bacterium RIFCSPLOWO2_02_FULL_37_18]